MAKHLLQALLLVSKNALARPCEPLGEFVRSALDDVRVEGCRVVKRRGEWSRLAVHVFPRARRRLVDHVGSNIPSRPSFPDALLSSVATYAASGASSACAGEQHSFLPSRQGCDKSRRNGGSRAKHSILVILTN